MSDISTFAEWEAQHPDESTGGVGSVKEREQKDMTGPARIWQDRDSSNDPRSSASPSNLSDANESPGGVKLEAATLDTTMDGIEPPSSTAPAPSLTQNGDATQPPQWRPEDFIPPPSSQPRPASEDEDTEDEEEDVFESFDVEADAKEFLQEMLGQAPPDELEMLRKARDDTGPDVDKPIRDFARSHPFFSQTKAELDTDGLVQFQQDVYAFSRAAGMGKQKARVDAMMAVAAWKSAMGLAGGMQLDELQTGSESELEVRYQQVPKLMAAEDYYWGEGKGKKKKKKNKNKKNKTGAEQASTQNEAAAEVEAIPSTGEKRKRDTLEDTTTPQVEADGSKPATKKAKRDAKKARERARKLEEAKQANGNANTNATTPMSVDGGTPETSKAPDSTATLEHTVSPPQQSQRVEPKRKRSKPGPTTSAYFTKPGDPPIKQEHSETVEDASTDGHQSSGLGKRARRRKLKKAALKGVESEKADSNVNASQPDQPTVNPPEPVEGMAMDIETDNKRPESQHTAIEEAKKAVTVGDAEIEDEATTSAKKHKRKRKRNHNKLPEDQVVSSEVDPSEKSKSHGQQKRDSHKSPPTSQEKRPRSQSSVSNATNGPSSERRNGLNSNPKDKASQNEVETTGLVPAEPLTELNNTNGNSQKLKRRARGRKRTSTTEQDAAESQEQAQQPKAHHP
jgi:hypothetical protein